jgi:hypothetical protein
LQFLFSAVFFNTDQRIFLWVCAQNFCPQVPQLIDCLGALNAINDKSAPTFREWHFNLKWYFVVQLLPLAVLLAVLVSIAALLSLRVAITILLATIAALLAIIAALLATIAILLAILALLAGLIAGQDHAAAPLRIWQACGVKPAAQGYILTAILALHDRADVLIPLFLLAIAVGVFAGHGGDVVKLHVMLL